MVFPFKVDSLDFVAGIMSEFMMASPLEPYSDAKAFTDPIPYTKTIISSAVIRTTPLEIVNLLVLLFTS